MKRTYAPREEWKGPAAGQERDPPQAALGSEQQLPERMPGALLSQLPSAPAARSLRQTAVRQMQQTHGNAHVQRELLSEINRQQEDEEEAGIPVEAQAPTAETEAPTAEAEAPAPTAQAPTTEAGAPAAETEAPIPTAQAPTTETGAPAAEAEAPAPEAQAPTGETEAPTTETEAPAAEAGQAPTTISGDGSTVNADASGVTIDGARLSVNAGMVNINSGMVTTSGVLRTSSLVADSVVASAYTPGAGNVW